MKAIGTTLTSILAITCVFVLLFGMNHDIFAQGYRTGTNTCIGRDDAPDDDGDGIPNGQDDDYAPPKDGTGKNYQKGNGKRAGQPHLQKGHRGRGNNDYVPVRDGTGNKYGRGKARRSTASIFSRKGTGFRNGKHYPRALIGICNCQARQTENTK